MRQHTNDRLLTAFAHSRFGQTRQAIAFRPRHGRCLSGVITLSGGRRVFVKQDPLPRNGLLECEAAMLAAFGACGKLRFAPQFVDFDQAQKILITEAAEGYVPLDRILLRSSLSDPMSSVAAATALANLHRQSPEVIVVGARQLTFPQRPARPLTPEEFAARPAGHAHLAAAIHQSRDSIGRLAAHWRSSHFIHGDFKADNLLVRMDPRLTELAPVVFVDWEMAGLGDPMWDVGSFIGSILLVWIRVLAPRAERDVALGSDDANAVRRQIGYFLLTYRHMAPRIFEAADSFALIVFQYAGIFMLHRIAVGLDSTGFLDPFAALLLDFARNLLNRPEAAVASLLAGLTL